MFYANPMLTLVWQSFLRWTLLFSPRGPYVWLGGISQPYFLDILLEVVLLWLFRPRFLDSYFCTIVQPRPYHRTGPSSKKIASNSNLILRNDWIECVFNSIIRSLSCNLCHASVTLSFTLCQNKLVLGVVNEQNVT